MHLQRCTKRSGGKSYAYWKLVESYRTQRGPRQRVVAYLGDLSQEKRLGIQASAEHGNKAPAWHQPELFEEATPEWAEVDTSRVRIENIRDFGGPWLGLQVLHKLGLVEFLQKVMPEDRAAVEWSSMALVLILARLCEPSSELHLAEHYYQRSGLSDLLGVPAQRVNDDRLYRALDQLLPHKEALEQHLKERLGTLFEVNYDLLLYDMTSAYFEGSCVRNEQAQRGYSRDHRGDCKQVTIALVVTRDGLPLGYQVFDGNRSDVTTVSEVVTRIEKLYGQANRIWVMDRGMVSQENVEWLRAGGRRYILGTAKGQLKQFERQLLEEDWDQVHPGLEVKLCTAPPADDQENQQGSPEVFILCRSADRQKKEQAMHDLFVKRIEVGLTKLADSCLKHRQSVGVMERRVGRLLGRNTRAEAMFEVTVMADATGAARMSWQKRSERAQWSRLSEGCYLLRSNITDWAAGDLWKAYIQLTQAETAFRIHKQDLSMRPIWHQSADRVQAHVLVCFLAYVVWKTLAMLSRQSGLGDEPRKVLAEIKEIRTVDVVMPTRSGVELRRRCVTQPTKHQTILLQHLGLQLPKSLKITPDPRDHSAELNP